MSENKVNDILEIGICCYCGLECNPLSQACGYCNRGISGTVIGIPTPEHLKKYVYPYCESCWTHDNLTHIHPESYMWYCQKCIDEKEKYNICERCDKELIAFTCENNNKLQSICKKCQCDGKNCEYC